MTKTALQVQTEALRHIGVADIEDTPDAADISRAATHLEGCYDFLSEVDELAMDWTTAAVPDAVWIGLSVMLAGSLASGYSKPEYIGEYQRGRGMVRDYEMMLNKVDNKPVPAVYF